MAKKLFVALLAITAAGCRMCSNSCDYSPAVAGSPYNGFDQRAGSAFNGEPLNTTSPVAAPVTAPTPPTPPTPQSPPATGLNPPAPLSTLAP